MEEAYFSLIIWAHSPNMDLFKNCLESIDDQEYREFELYVIDEGADKEIETTVKEFFPDMVDKVHYRSVTKKQGGAYAYNIGSRFAEGNHLVFIDQHDRLNPNTLTQLKLKIEELGPEEDTIIYTDHDEIVGLDRMNPHFKSDFNKELLLHTDYIGWLQCISKQCYKKLGAFNEKATTAFFYEYLLRANSKRVHIHHIPQLLYHRRQQKRPSTAEEKKQAEFVQKEYMALAQAHLKGEGVDCQIMPGGTYSKWNVEYDNSKFMRYGGDYMFLHDPNVRLFTRKNVKYMYGYLKQPDVAVVGIRFLEHFFTIDNIGFIYDNEGIAYPAFHGQKVYQESYEDLATLPRDVSFVDAGCCLIDAKVYRMLHGFDASLSGRDAMLDFCLRAKEKGYRTIVVPRCTGRYKVKNNDSTENSHNVLLSKWAETIGKGDKFYNINLPLGMDNFKLPGAE